MATPTTLPATFVSGNVLTAAQMNDLRGAFRVLQVVSTTKTDTFVSSALNFGAVADITGLSATITPSSTSSKILVSFNVNGATEFNGYQYFFFAARCKRGATLIGVGDASSSRSRVSGQNGMGGYYDGMGTIAQTVLDSPSSTSALTYQIEVINATYSPGGADTTGVFYVNRNYSDPDNAYTPRAASSITLMEISA